MPKIDPDTKTDRERAWEHVKQRRTFWVTDLVEEVGMSRSNAQRFCRELEKRGVLEGRREARPSGTTEKRYRLASIPNSRRPWLGDPASLTWQQQVWNTMRMMRRFTLDEVMRGLSEDPGAAYDTIRRWAKVLAEAGVLHRLGRDGDGRHIYCLAAHGRPEPPTVRAGKVLTDDDLSSD
jgi:predicted ArsR family transcriptional regulator